MTPEALKAGDKAGDTLLEKLRAALVSLGKHPYYFPDWSTCTCGHIYRAAMGRGTKDEWKVLGCEDDRFRALLAVVCEAHDLPVSAIVSDLREQVSLHTIDVANELIRKEGLFISDLTYSKLQPYRKRAAIKIIEKAIEFETERNEKARLALIGQ